MSYRFHGMLSLSFSLCALADVWAAQPVSAVQRAELYARATNAFAGAAFYKPAQTTNTNLSFQLAPLILQEAKDDQQPAGLRRDQFGTLSVSNGVLVIEPSRPAIYWAADSVEIQGKPHSRFSYLWRYRAREPRARPPGLPSQGIRITLNSLGQPVIWEVLADTFGAQLIFVAQSLESAAAAQFGKPLPGRRYAIERSVDEVPGVIVARVLDDGPMAMGPIVYLNAGTRDVSTLICRCMPAQAKTLVATSGYELAPFSMVAAELTLIRAKLPRQSLAAFWPGDSQSGNRAEKCLRLAGAF